MYQKYCIACNWGDWRVWSDSL